MLHEFEDVFSDEILSGLPPIKGIKHQIDLVSGSAIHYKPAYISNLGETNELQMQVEELMLKNYIRESISPCVIPRLLVPKKDGT